MLSEHTTVEDLLGRDLIDENNVISFYKGIVLDAYTEGKIVILDECDLASSEVLSCILETITNDEITIKNKIYYKNDNYMVILTMNGESVGFDKNQRNVLSSHLLCKFNITNFRGIDKNESEKIFKEQIEKSQIKDINSSNFIELHEKMNNKEQKTIEPIVTLRNLKNSILLIKNGISQRISAEISYTRRFPEEERKEFENILNKFGELELDKELREKIKNKFEEKNILYDDNYIIAIYLALIACKKCFHPLLIGKNGIGLTKAAKILAELYFEEHEEYEKNEEKKEDEKNDKKYKILLCCSEVSNEDII